jgi:hypothetical protein
MSKALSLRSPRSVLGTSAAAGATVAVAVAILMIGFMESLH